MSTPATRKPLLLDLIGFEERSRAALELAISNRAKGRCVLAHSSVATAVLINLDHAGAMQLWDKFRNRYPGRLAIFTSLYEGKQPADAPFLKKPISIEQFVALLDRMAKQSAHAAGRSESLQPARADATLVTRRRNTTVRTVRSAAPAPKRTKTLQLATARGGAATKATTQRTAGAAASLRKLQERSHTRSFEAPAETIAGDKLIDPLPDVDCAVAEAVASHTHAGPAKLLGVLKKVAEDVAAAHKAQRVKIGAADWITFSADGDLVWTSLDEERFDALFAEAADARVTVVACLPDEEKMAEAAAKWCAETELILWRAACATYRGKLPAGTDPTLRVYLGRWPNLTRVLEIPNAVRIAALWAEQRLSLAFTAEILKIPQRYVFAFYGAAHAAGICGPVKRSEDVIVAEAQIEPNSRRGLFAKILGRLRGRSA